MVNDNAGVGLNRVYLDRKAALNEKNFYTSIEKEHDEIFVIGSSLLGFLVDKHF